MNTLEKLIGDHGVEVDAHLDRQITVPVSSGLQRQGDVIVIPAAMVEDAGVATTLVPAAGYPAVRGEAGGNTHLLLAAGPGVCYDSIGAVEGDLKLGTLTVAEGSMAYLAHPEHGYTGIAAGTYVLRRQREQADEIRMVQD